jgi:ubiquinone/menaquinone biosynthesis C-methylase UbiE
MKREQKQKHHIIKEYSTFWQKQVNIYGYSYYHKGLIGVIKSLKDGLKDNKILEVGVGTCYPFASNLSSDGFEVSGVDIAESLIKICREKYPQIKSVVGDAEKLPYKDKSFSLTYCLQSCWYFPNIENAIKEIFRVTTEGGYILFDVMNSFSPYIQYNHIKAKTIGGIGQILSNIKNHKKIFSNLYFHEIPSSPLKISKILNKLGSQYKIATPVNLNFEQFNKINYFGYRLIYLCKK